MRNFIASLFGCAHRRTTWPLTLQGRTWVTCLGCGREFAYDWKLMKTASESDRMKGTIQHDGSTTTGNASTNQPVTL